MKEKKTALKKAEKEVATLEAKKAKTEAKAAEEVAGKRDECGRDPRKTEINKNPRQKKRPCKLQEFTRSFLKVAV